METILWEGEKGNARRVEIEHGSRTKFFNQVS
jgi:hypothetical protein